MSIPSSLEILVRRCQRAPADDPRPFEALVAQTKNVVFRIAYRLLGDVQEAEDQTQEVFLKVHRSIRTLDDPAFFMAWLIRIATNTCLDARSKRQRQIVTTPFSVPGGGNSDEIHYADTHTLSPEEAVLRREVQHCIQQTFAEMEQVSRAVLVLRDVEDRPYQEIADTFSLKLSAVKMRIHRARLQFQQLLVRICPDTAYALQAVE